MGYAACWRPMQLQLRESNACADLEVRRARPLLGTVVEIRATARTPRKPDPAFAELEIARLHTAIDTAFNQVELVHQLMSYQDPDSELSRLNRCEANIPQGVNPHTYQVLTAAVGFARLSGGAFDPCVASQFASWEDIELLSGYRVRFKRRLRIDLGGIAKGYAVDVATQKMQSANVDEILINAGGDLRVAGTRVHEICLRHPQAPTVGVNPLQLRNGALASSGAYFSPALLEPRTQEPYTGSDAVSVRAGDCMTADALTKVVLFAPTSIAERALDECGAEAFVLRAQP